MNQESQRFGVSARSRNGVESGNSNLSRSQTPRGVTSTKRLPLRRYAAHARESRHPVLGSTGSPLPRGRADQREASGFTPNSFAILPSGSTSGGASGTP